MVLQVELITQIDQLSARKPNPGEEANWRDAIIDFFKQGRLLEDLGQAQQIKWRAMRFTLIDNNLYKRIFSHSLLRCLGLGEVEYVLQEFYKGSSGSHVGGRNLA